MSGLVERLRADADALDGFFYADDRAGNQAVADLREAAAEIERLHQGGEMSDEFYKAYLAEMDKVTVKADAPAVALMGVCIRAAKRAQMVVDGEEVSEGPWECSANDPGVEVKREA